MARRKGSEGRSSVRSCNDNYALALMGDVVSEEHLEKELAIIERLDTRITRATKMLMQAKVMKEIMGTGSNNRAKIHAVGHSAGRIGNHAPGRDQVVTLFCLASVFSLQHLSPATPMPTT